MDKQLLHEFLDHLYDDCLAATDSSRERELWELEVALGRCYPELMQDYTNIWEAIQGEVVC